MSLKKSVTGVLLLDKSKGYSSNKALQWVKRLFNAEKAGHAGTLDPIATGMLPICFGAATKFSEYLLSSEKAYQVTMQLGACTDTGDIEGKIISQAAVPSLSQECLEPYLAQFRGAIQQVPPMYSALKYRGRPLYQLARQGKEVARPPRSVHIYKLQLDEILENKIVLEVVCSKGTYIRSLVEDLGKAIGCGGYVVDLRRLWVAPYQQQPMATLQALSQYVDDSVALERWIVPLETIFSSLSSVELSEGVLRDLYHGRKALREEIFLDNVAPGRVRLVDTVGKFRGVGEVSLTKTLEVKRLYPAQQCLYYV
eukprot:TRINITY_DN3102_c2_g1_i1.p3 TRINITY_DN3102_c2_g1~~TRINITY_DN3102_c2_g1_i1.p3  ORF type:complete len:311 (+),score=-54.00 TRINITY_DN3102_c2_g1_i1:5429-6361(+)